MGDQEFDGLRFTWNPATESFFLGLRDLKELSESLIPKAEKIVLGGRGAARSAMYNGINRHMDSLRVEPLKTEGVSFERLAGRMENVELPKIHIPDGYFKIGRGRKALPAMDIIANSKNRSIFNA